LKRAASIAVGFVALLHVWFFVLETFLWQSAFALKTLEATAAQAEATAVLAANQGVYNLVFAVGLGWALFTRNAAVIRFFLIAIISVGIFGAVSARWTILFLQALPAAIALGLSELSRPREA
jgi:putative membrane protein